MGIKFALYYNYAFYHDDHQDIEEARMIEIEERDSISK